MRCPSCNSENPEITRFCGSCGRPLTQRCGNCGTENPSQFKFCGECGAALIDAAASGVVDTAKRDRASDGVLEVTNRREGERRHLTVLFCDLVGSTALAAHLDPEEWRAIVADYHLAVGKAVERFGGYVAQYLGDGVMAYFGWPEAHDNDAERAAHAGLAILDAIAKLNEQLGRQELSARVGIDSGAVVVGASAGKDADVFGDAPNIAARVQAAAEPGTVLITDAVHRLVSGLFVVEDRGAQALKGIGRPVQLYRVIQRSGVRGRLEAAASAHGLTPFVGREDELRSLRNRWERVLDGEGQVALIIGEAGIGKSRLVQRFHEQIKGTPHTWVEAATAPFYHNTPFYPVSEVFRQLVWEQSFALLDDYLRQLQMQEREHGGNNALRRDEPAEQLAQLESGLTTAGLKPAETIPLIAPLLNLPLTEKYPSSSLSPEQQRRRLLATLVEWVLGAARVRPLIIAIEDLHWADPSTLELIQLLVEQGAMARLLLLYTARPEFRAEWPLRAHHAQITLNRLSAGNVRTMVEKVAAGKSLSDATIATVVERTGGVPLFVEELTRAVLESGDAQLNAHQIPVTLHDSLMARLDRLGPAKEVAQVGAVIGGAFSYELLHAVYPIAEEDLESALRNVADAELIYVRGIPPEATYQFKHALIRDTAYEALLRSRRRELHKNIAETLEERFPELVKSQAEIVAHHYTEAGLTAQAVRYWRKAGQKATERSAHMEAISHLNKGLELIKALPETPERMSEELRLQIAVTAPLTVTKGFTAPEVEKACSRAMDLSQQIGENPRLFDVLARLYSVYSNRGELQKSLDLAEQMLRLAGTRQEPLSLLWAHYCLGHTLANQGKFEAARVHTEQCLARYDFDQPREYGWIMDPGATGLARLAHILHQLGYPDQALGRSLKAIEHARSLSQPFTLAWVLGSVAAIYAFRCEFEIAERLWAEEVALCAEHNFSSALASAIVGRGWAIVEQGRREEDIPRMQQGLDAFPAAEPWLERGNSLIRMAYAYRRVRWPKEGLAVVAEALKLVDETGAPVFGAALYHLKGDMLLMQDFGNESDAEQCFRDAIEIARHQSAKSWELRTTMSLARLLEKQGNRNEAREMLAEIYGWFTEGFDTADLKDAKALLDQLNGCPDG